MTVAWLAVAILAVSMLVATLIRRRARSRLAVARELAELEAWLKAMRAPAVTLPPMAFDRLPFLSTPGVFPLDIEAMFPADPDLMASPEGDARGLQELRTAARARVDELERLQRRNAP